MWELSFVSFFYGSMFLMCFSAQKFLYIKLKHHIHTFFGNNNINKFSCYLALFIYFFCGTTLCTVLPCHCDVSMDHIYISDNINFYGHKLCSHSVCNCFLLVVVVVESLWHSRNSPSLSFNGTFISNSLAYCYFDADSTL